MLAAGSRGFSHHIRSGRLTKEVGHEQRLRRSPDAPELGTSAAQSGSGPDCSVVTNSCHQWHSSSALCLCIRLDGG